MVNFTVMSPAAAGVAKWALAGPGHGSRAWWKTASKTEREVALSYVYRYLVNGKFHSGLDLLYIDPEAVYIPPKRSLGEADG